MYPFLPYNSTPKDYMYVVIKKTCTFGEKGDHVIILELLTSWI